MAFMDDVLGKMSQASQTVGKKARDLSDYAKHSGVISDSESEIRTLYSEIGAKVYQAYRDKPLPEVAPQIARITALIQKIEEARAAQRALNESDKCPKCGNRIRPGMTFCNYCGYRLVQQPPQQAGPNMQPRRGFCRSCGAPLTEGALFCMSCGAKVKAPAPAPAPASTPAPAPTPADAMPQTPQSTAPSEPAQPVMPEASQSTAPAPAPADAMPQTPQFTAFSQPDDLSAPDSEEVISPETPASSDL